MTNIPNLVDRKFGMLMVTEFSHTRGGHSHWRCLCDCGNVTTVAGTNLKTNRTQSCGCYRDGGEYAVRHGMIRTPEYTTWHSMKQRCLNPNRNNYKNYGGRGITVCERWMDSFENFYKDMGPKPDTNYVIDRINNDGNYEPNNCQWITRSESTRKRNKL